ncbi:MAG TPA: glycosyltransferase family 4 protein [Acidimicrobiales bacterium]|nr:glycosyltransferase family 4 protein [Acidimicrobiales bacterium]
MKVTHVGLETTSMRPGGLNRYLEDLLAAQRAAGTDAIAVVLGDAEQSAHTDGITIARGVSGSMLTAAAAVDRAVRATRRPDLADAHFAGTSVLTTTIGALRSVPLVVHFQGPWANESAHAGSSRWNVAVKRVVERLAYRRADRFIVLSDAFAEILASTYGVARWSIEVIAPGVDLERFSPGDRGAARLSLGVTARRVALSVRRLVPRMGLEVLLEAWRELQPRDDDLLVIVGDGTDGARLRALASSLGIASSVRFCGTVADASLVEWYRAADVTVVPSVALEGFGLVVLESLACGTPVVGTDAGGLREAIALAGEQTPVPAGDARALAAAISGALAAPETTERAARRRAVAAQHSWASVAERHELLYARVLDGSEPLRAVVLDHTAVLSGGELAIARAVGGLGSAATVHTILGADGPLRRRLEDAGSTVEVLELDDRARHVNRSTVRPGRLDPRAVVATARYVIRLARRLRVLRPDVVHTNTLKSALYGGAAARLAGIPCVWHVRDRIATPYLPEPAVRLVRVAARILPSVVVANSESTLRALGVEGLVLPSPLDPSIDPHRVPLERGRHGPLRVTVLGRLAPWKGQDLAIDAFADAFGTSGATLRIVGAPLFGEEEFAASLRARAAALGVGACVEFLGFVDDVAAVLEETDVLVHCSTIPEPFGQVVVEAMGAGCAVIVPDQGGPAEVVTDGLDGITYAMGESAALSKALRRLAHDEALRVRLGEAAVGTAAAYTPEALAPRLLAAWRSASDGGRRARRRRRG